MIGMVLVTHGRLATEFRAALEHVVGPQKQVETVTIMPEDDMEQRRKDIIAAIRSVEGGSGVILLTDMFGGTPSNLAISVMEGSRVDVVAGINLPMLIKLASVRDQSSLEQAVVQAQDAGRKYISVARRPWVTSTIPIISGDRPWNAPHSLRQPGPAGRRVILCIAIKMASEIYIESQGHLRKARTRLAPSCGAQPVQSAKAGTATPPKPA